MTPVLGFVQPLPPSTAPASIPASRVIDGRVDRTRPLCPYPQQAAYRGSGDINDARNFVCR
ncbi:MAG: tannase/feruloyl esterase family alpha/beta hydrolase [Acidobacteria bacterium]|nr:tannase/feruloyl esterase family alpha/beta hydrolase [Acidobacteriota bacterium]